MARTKFYISNKDESAYHIDFDYEFDAERWLADHAKYFPEHTKENGLHIVEKEYISYSEKLTNLLEQAVEELENCYGKDTELTIKIRKFINTQ